VDSLIERFTSGLAYHIQGFLEQKRAFGFKYEENVRYLFNFDKMCSASFPTETIITREMGMIWATAYPDERKEGLARRMSPVRELARYMNRNGIPAFVIPAECGKYPNRRYSPHIFSEDELTRIYEASDNLRANAHYPTNHLIIPVLLRLLYACGLRPYEGRLIKRKDINLDKGTIFIPESKKFRERIVVMDGVMKKLCQDYDEAVRVIEPYNEYFFPSNGKKQPVYDRHWVGRVLYRCLTNAGITEFIGNPPRPYDFRHTFATNTLFRWLREGRDLENSLAYLSAFMGHERFEHTAYYIHLVPDFFAQIPPKISAKYAALMPEVEQ